MSLHGFPSVTPCLLYHNVKMVLVLKYVQNLLLLGEEGLILKNVFTWLSLCHFLPLLAR